MRPSNRAASAFLGVMLAFVVAGTACSTSEADALPNVRLGMSPRDVRERFQRAGEGRWQTAVGADNDTILEWTARDPKASIPHARFEFHLGMLVAIRATTAATTSGEKISLTPKTVTVRSPAPEGGSTVTVLARDCPTHKDEAEALAARAR